MKNDFNSAFSVEFLSVYLNINICGTDYPFSSLLHQIGRFVLKGNTVTNSKSRFRFCGCCRRRKKNQVYFFSNTDMLKMLHFLDQSFVRCTQWDYWRKKNHDGSFGVYMLRLPTRAASSRAGFMLWECIEWVVVVISDSRMVKCNVVWFVSSFLFGVLSYFLPSQYRITKYYTLTQRLFFL